MIEEALKILASSNAPILIIGAIGYWNIREAIARIDKRLTAIEQSVITRILD